MIVVAVGGAAVALLPRRDSEHPQRASTVRGPKPVIRATLTPEATANTVTVRVQNVGLVPAVDVVAHPRALRGVGVPVEGDSIAALGPNQEATLKLARLRPINADARSEFDLVYSDVGQSVVKRQLWVFYLGNDVVKMREFSDLVFELKWPEVTMPRTHLLNAEGRVQLLSQAPRGAFGPNAPVRTGPAGTAEVGNLSEAWLMKYGSYLTGSTLFVRVLRAIKEQQRGSRGRKRI